MTQRKGVQRFTRLAIAQRIPRFPVPNQVSKKYFFTKQSVPLSPLPIQIKRLLPLVGKYGDAVDVGVTAVQDGKQLNPSRSANEFSPPEVEPNRKVFFSARLVPL